MRTKRRRVTEKKKEAKEKKRGRGYVCVCVCVVSMFTCLKSRTLTNHARSLTRICRSDDDDDDENGRCL